MAFDGFQAGVNLGGWLSQYRQYDPAHFESFITEADIRQIAGWGMDHVRLPVDYPVLESDDQPGVYRESGFAYLDRCLDWCAAAGLNVVLDLHKAPGYAFYELAENRLFQDEAQQQRLIALWTAIARRYAERRTPALVFELLNEIVLPDSAPWNALAARLHRAIRAAAPDPWIMVGGNFYGAVDQLQHLDLFPDDARTVYTFHFYHPMPFTHQKASWVPVLARFDRATAYPDAVSRAEADAFLAAYDGPDAGLLADAVGVPLDGAYLQEKLQPAVDFLAATGQPLYCGEFGAIDVADAESRRRWHADFIALLREHGIGRAVWSYKEMDFRLVDASSRVTDPALVRIVSAC